MICFLTFFPTFIIFSDQLLVGGRGKKEVNTLPIDEKNMNILKIVKENSRKLK